MSKIISYNKRLAIEIDGMSHKNLGVRFIRFIEAETKYDIQNVIRANEGKVVEIIKSNKTIRLPKDFDLSALD